MILEESLKGGKSGVKKTTTLVESKTTEEDAQKERQATLIRSV
jgi:hypothetical protein